MKYKTIATILAILLALAVTHIFITEVMKNRGGYDKGFEDGKIDWNEFVIMKLTQSGNRYIPIALGDSIEYSDVVYFDIYKTCENLK